MRADSAVEPTKSENMTVTWRPPSTRSAKTDAERLIARVCLVASDVGVFTLAPFLLVNEPLHS